MLLTQTNLKLLKGLSSTLLCLSLAACFNSSDNSNPSTNKLVKESKPDTETPQETVSFDGKAANGSLSYGAVDVYVIDDGVVDTTPALTTETDSEGAFSATLTTNESTDLLLIEVTATENSKIRCDIEECGSTVSISGEDSNNDGVIGYGEYLEVPQDFKISAIVSPDFADSHGEISVTPLTHLVADKALSQGTAITVESINLDSALVAKSLGLSSNFEELQSSTLVFSDESIDFSDMAYSLYSLSFFSFANENNYSIVKAITVIGQELFTDEGLNQKMVLQLLDLSLKEARFLSQGNVSLLQLIADIRLVINRYECNLEGGENCDDIPPLDPELSPEEELALVKNFVGNLRSTIKDFTTNGSTAVDEFAARTEMIGDIWERDLKELLSVVNDLVPGLAQTISPYYDFCYYCWPVTDSDGTKTLNYNDLVFTLSPDGFLNISGSLRETSVEMDLMLPTIDVWDETHRIEIIAGKVSREATDLVFSEGSFLEATYDNDLTFKNLANTVTTPWSSTPEPNTLALNAKFLVQAEYEVFRYPVIDFESGSLSDQLVSFSGNWAISKDNPSTGKYALKSKRITHSQQSSSSISFETSGGEFSFDYAYDSEAHYDYFDLYLNGRRVLSRSGSSNGYQHFSRNLSPGHHDVRWVYRKDFIVSRGQDTAWIDNILLPPLVGQSNLPTELVTKNIMVGDLFVDVNRINGSWAASNAEYLPGEISLNADLTNEFTNVTENIQGTDKVGLNLTAVIVNAAEFVPPRKYDPNTLSELGYYTVADNKFDYYLNNTHTSVEKIYSGYFKVVTVEQSTGKQLSYRYIYPDTDKVEIAAAQAINNSGIGTYIVDRERGIFKTTLLNASPWGKYEESQFSKDGGQIFGLLVLPYQPEETEAQFIEAAISLELSADLPDFGSAAFATRLNRESLTKGDFEFVLTKDDQDFKFTTDLDYTTPFLNEEREVETTEPKIVISNIAGVVMELQKREVSGDKQSEEIYGDIKYKGTTYGTVQRIKGLTAIRYTDGTGETLE